MVGADSGVAAVEAPACPDRRDGAVRGGDPVERGGVQDDGSAAACHGHELGVGEGMDADRQWLGAGVVGRGVGVLQLGAPC